MATAELRHSTLGYRPWLDGVRAIAIAMVIIEHGFAVDGLNFGGTGVGIFFALSGYLITRLLLGEAEKNGKIDLKVFWIRRFARLMPALLLLIVVSDAVFLYFGMYAEAKGAIPALVYLTNYATLFAGHHIYGFGHTWSLAVEEHFYLLWPFALSVFLGRWDLRRTLHVTLAICVAILVWRIFLVQMGWGGRILYVGSIERADSILYGAAVAMAMALGYRPRWWFWPICIAAVLYHLYLPPAIKFPAFVPAVLAVGVSLGIWVLEQQSPAWLRRFLGFTPLAWIGVMSYGIYLWHGTMFLLMHRFGDSLGLKAAVISACVLAAYLSHRFIEIPIQAAAKRRWKPQQP